MTAAEGKTVGAAKRRRVWLLALGLSMGPAVATGYARFAYGLILPAMRRDLGWSYAQAGWINTANALGYFAGAWATLMLIRRIGPKPMFCGGMILTAAALLLSAVSRDLLALTVCRFVPPYQQHDNADIDLRFDRLMADLQLPVRDAHDALNDAVMAALAFIKLRQL